MALDPPARMSPCSAAAEVAFVSGLLWLCFPMPPAFAHSWYPQECCQGIECQPLPKDRVREVPGGWMILDNDEFIPFSQARPSPDGQFHRCVKDFWVPNSPTRCFFAPEFGS